MQKRKLIVNNIAVTGLFQIFTILFGFIIPRLFLEEYGTEIHGLTSTVTNILTYISLLNAGLLTASVQALYKPLADKDVRELNSVLKAIKKYYDRIGVLYTLVVIVVAIMLPFIVNSNIDNFVIFWIMIVMGLSNILDSFLGAKYRALIQADQKYWIISLCNLIVLTVRSFLQILCIKYHASIIVVQALPALMTIGSFVFFNWYVHSQYTIVSNVEPNILSLNQTSAALIHQIAGVIVNNTDTILLTIFCSLSLVSIYSVYQLVFVHINGLLMQLFMYSVVASFGHLIVSNDKEKINKYFSLYESGFFMIVTVILTTTSVMIGPFIEIYTRGVGNVQYFDLKLVILFVVISVLNNVRIPGIMLINAAGHYKKTQYRALIEASINLSMSLLLIKKYGIYGVLFATVLSFLYRTTDVFIYTNKYILDRKTIKPFIRTISIFLIIIVSNKLIDLFEFTVSSWTNWICVAFITIFIVTCITVVFWLLFDSSAVKAIFDYTKRIVYAKIRKENC